MTAASVGEQSAAGLDALSPAEFARLADLNTAYRTKFGFPFILAVKGAKSRDIIAALERRFANSPDEEFREALHQVYRIARFRLESTLVPPPSDFVLIGRKSVRAGQRPSATLKAIVIMAKPLRGLGGDFWKHRAADSSPR